MTLTEKSKLSNFLTFQFQACDYIFHKFGSLTCERPITQAFGNNQYPFQHIIGFLNQFHVFIITYFDYWEITSNIQKLEAYKQIGDVLEPSSSHLRPSPTPHCRFRCSFCRSSLSRFHSTDDSSKGLLSVLSVAPPLCPCLSLSRWVSLSISRSLFLSALADHSISFSRSLFFSLSRCFSLFPFEWVKNKIQPSSFY